MTDTPPPYFPQNPLSPPDPERYRKFKLAVAGCVTLIVLFMVGLIGGLIYLIRS